MNHSDSAMRQAGRKRFELMKLWLALGEALDSDTRKPFFVSPQAIELAKKIRWHIRRVSMYGFTNIDTLKPRFNSLRTFKSVPERVKIFEKCATAIQSFIKQLPPESESIKAAMALLDAVGDGKKGIRV